MRARALVPAACLLSVLAACSGGSEATPSVQLEPIAPLRDWASLATRPTAKASGQADDSAGRGTPGTIAADASRPRAAEGPRPGETGALAGSAGASLPARSGADPGSPTRPYRRHALYAGLAKDSFLVIDVPDLARLPELYRESELSRLLERPELSALRAGTAEMWTQGLAKLRAEAPCVEAALALVPTLGGGLSIGVSGLTAETLGAAPTHAPWVVTALYDAGPRADRVAEVLAPMFATLAEERGWPLVEKAEPAWGCEIGDGDFLLDFERHDDVFTLRLGGRAAVVRELASARKRGDANSFISARVAVDAASVEALGAVPGLEVHLQLSPLWDALRTNGDRAEQRGLERTGLPQLLGATLAVGRTEHGLAEALTLHSPSGVDLLTHVFTGQPLDRALARCVPAELPNAGLASFDGTRVIPDLCLLLPPPMQAELVRSLAGLRTATGIDLEKDVFGNFGSTVVYAGGPLEAATAEQPVPDFFVACQVADPARAQRTLNAVLVASGRSAEARENLVDGSRVFSLRVPLDDSGAKQDLHWCITEGVLLGSNRLEHLRAGLRGLRGKGDLHTGLQRALLRAGPECFAASFTRGEGATADSIDLGRRTTAGLEFTSTDGRALKSTVVSAFTAGIVSSVAIPKLLSLRSEANEKAAVSTLTAVHDAELMAHMRDKVDADGDGRGESLFLPELCGAAPPRGSAAPIEEPWLEARFAWVAPGVGQKDGYRFRVDLSGADGTAGPCVEVLAGGIVDPDRAEGQFAVFAWPMDATTGSAVFVLDTAGGLYRSDNRAEGQRYSGERAPRFDAHWASPDGPGEGTRYVGRDGGVWLCLRGL